MLQKDSPQSLFNDTSIPHSPQPEESLHLKDRTEIDLQLGALFVEAKLTESNFQTVSPRLVERYRDFEAVFAVERLPSKIITRPTHPSAEDFSDLEEPSTNTASQLPTPVRSRTVIQGYQLIRNVLAAFHSNASFCVLCDSRRQDLIEIWYSVLAAVHYPSFAWRLKLLTWQELTSVIPEDLQQFLETKYGILPAM
ncbi:PGN_0703 family putative restriction endonuclease [Tunturiibacter empetritectus]|uniref:PGN_0703 family putative restriction endonuclease n=1 Tax=Tunturiibacter empetritectus TaxID=3069691 RepID=UPI003D9BD16C